MQAEADQRGITNPLMVADVVARPDKWDVIGSDSIVYPVLPREWDELAAGAPGILIEDTPSVYLVDGNKYTAPI
jgi:hypothetical protein